MTRNIRIRIRPRGDSAIASTGFDVTLFLDGQDDVDGKLPPLSEGLQQSFQNWWQSYYGQEAVRSYCSEFCAQLETAESPAEAVETNTSLYRATPGRVIRRNTNEIRRLSDLLKQDFNQWLEPKQDWASVRDRLIASARNHELHREGQTQITLDLRDEDIILKRLPWQEWTVLQEYHSLAEVTLRANSRHQWRSYGYPKSSKIRILVVIGDSNADGTTIDIDVSRDLQVLYDLERANPRVEIHALEQPSRQALQEKLEDEAGYHIFVFAGHSHTQVDGQVGWLILKSTEEPLSIDDFRENLREAIRKGLKLAIFNSCDGLGIARQIADLHLPQCIVMREPVPDEVAVEFIKRFFDQFAHQQKSLIDAVRIARRGLETLNNTKFPGVMWLPTVCTKMDAEPLTWQKLVDHLPPVPQVQRERRVPTRWVLGGIVALALLGFGSWVMPQLCQQGNLLRCLVGRDDSTEPDTDRLVSSGAKPIDGSSRLSGDYQKWKEAGIQAFGEKRYVEARDWFDKIRRAAKNNPKEPAAAQALKDPEILMYRNNAEARSRYQQGQPIYTVAAVVPLSNVQGAALWEGQQILFGIAQAQDQAVQKGINLEIVLANDLNDSDQAEKVAEYLTQLEVDGQPILAVIGHYTSKSTCAALQVYKNTDLVVISGTSTVSDLRGCSGGDTFFRTTSSSVIETKSLIDYLLKLKPDRPKIALFYNSNDSFSQDMRSKFKQQLGNKGLITQEINLNPETNPAFNVSEVIKQIADADALAMFPDGRSGGSGAFDRAVALIKATNGGKLILGSAPLHQAAAVIEGGGVEKLKNQLITAVDWHRSCSDPRFVQQSEQEYWFGGINRLAALSYEATQVLAETLSPSVTSSQIQQRLAAGVNIESAVFNNKNISFDENGDRREIQQRVITTPSGEDKNVTFDRPAGVACPS